MKAGENDRFEFHKDFRTDYIEKKLREIDEGGLSFPRFRAYRTVAKSEEYMDHDGEYIIMDEQKMPVMEMTGDYYEIDFKMLILREIYKDRIDLVRIAETGEMMIQ